MGEQTGIEWTNHTFNPWIGCEKVSQECKHCYAEDYARRWLANEKLWGGKNAARHLTSEPNWKKPIAWNRKAEEAGVKEFVFCASLSDWAEDRPGLDALRERLFGLIRQTPNLIYQLLTKRYLYSLCYLYQLYISPSGIPGNIILGFTAGTNESARNARTALLAVRRQDQMPPVRLFLSCEPLLEDIHEEIEKLVEVYKPAQIIVGGESGKYARRMELQWALNLRDLCRAHEIPFLFKQWGEYGQGGKRVGKHVAGRLLNGELYNGMPNF